MFGVEKAAGAADAEDAADAEGAEGAGGVEGAKGVKEGRDGQWPRIASSGGHIGHEMHALLHSDLRNKVHRVKHRVDRCV